MANFFAQCAGSIVGAGFLALAVRDSSDLTSTLASNIVAHGYTNASHARVASRSGDAFVGKRF